METLHFRENKFNIFANEENVGTTSWLVWNELDLKSR